MSDVKVRYVGHQPTKRASDLVESCTVVWIGHGDVQDVSEAVARVLLQPQYNKIWVAAVAAPLPEVTSSLAQASGGAPVVPVVPVVEPVVTPVIAQPPVVTAEEMRARIEEIIIAWPKLKLTDFNPTGKPKLGALRPLLGRMVTQAEVDAAFSVLQDKTGVDIKDTPEPAAVEPATEAAPVIPVLQPVIEQEAAAPTPPAAPAADVIPE